MQTSAEVSYFERLHQLVPAQANDFKPAFDRIVEPESHRWATTVVGHGRQSGWLHHPVITAVCAPSIEGP